MTIGTQVVAPLGHVTIYTNTSTEDNEVVIQTDDVSQFDTFMLMSVTGTVDVYPSIDGTNYATAALSLQDMGATTSDPVVVTAAARVYGFRGKFRKLRVLEAGATDVAVSLLCSRMPSQ
jgi:hypothetical protein